MTESTPLTFISKPSLGFSMAVRSTIQLRTVRYTSRLSQISLSRVGSAQTRAYLPCHRKWAG
eukprot:7793521-Pyramimonas_sp.AAC.2